MKLRNKNTGAVVEWENPLQYKLGREYHSIKEFVEDWEDYEEPKGSALDLMILTLTNFIENEPDEDKVDVGDCNKMLGKLKAWERLKDKGFRLKTWGWENKDRYSDYCIWFTLENNDDTAKDLDLLFGGEE